MTCGQSKTSEIPLPCGFHGCLRREVRLFRLLALTAADYLLVTSEQLESETAEQRADFVNLLLPLLISPFRVRSL